jgi:hypothetical protein
MQIQYLQPSLSYYLLQYNYNTIAVGVLQQEDAYNDNTIAINKEAFTQNYPSVPYLTKDEVYNNYAGVVVYQDKVKAFNANYDRAKKSIKIWIENGIFTGSQTGLVDFQGSNNANLSNIENLTQLFKQFADEALASNGYGKTPNEKYGYWQTAFNIAYQNSKSVISIEMNPFEVIHINRAIASQKRAYWDLVAKYNIKMNDLQLAYNNWLNATDATIKNQYLQDLIDFNVSVEDYNIISRWIVNLPVLEATLKAYEQEDNLVKCFSGVGGLTQQETYNKWKADFIKSRTDDVDLLKTAIEVGTGFSFGDTKTKLKGFANYSNDITALLTKQTEDNLGMGYVENDLIFVLNANDLLNENIFVEPSVETTELANNQVQVVATQNFKSCVVKLQIVDGVLKPVLQTKNNKSTFTIQSKIVYKKEDNVLVSREFIVS